MDPKNFYGSAKIHKLFSDDENNLPLRPIVSSFIFVNSDVRNSQISCETSPSVW